MKEYSALSSNPHEADLNQDILEHEKLVGWVVRRQWSGWAGLRRRAAGGSHWAVAGVAGL
jgi:hypothetical protein